MSHPSKGFSLIELMVVLSVAGILLTVAVPSFVSLIQRNRVSTEVNGFIGDLQFARSEAIKQGLAVSVCPSSSGTSCLKTNTWQAGWIVFSNAKATGNVETGDTVLRMRPAWKGGDTLTAAPALLSLTYNRDGFALVPGNAQGTTLMTLRTSPANASATRCVAINRVGYQKLYKSGENGCT